jgi:hypothetical protein
MTDDVESSERTMSMPQAPIEPTKRCGECNKEIKQPEAMSPEGQEYALFFCGFECYQKWRQRDKRDHDTSRE